MSRYILKTTFEYAAEGEQADAQFLELSPPTPKHIADLAPVRAEVMKAIHWATNQSDVESTEADELADDGKTASGAMVMTTLELAPDIDVSRIILHVSNMLVGKKGLATVDAENRFTQHHYDNLSIPDIYGVTGEFIASFIIPSL
jgi:hypothetical protein